MSAYIFQSLLTDRRTRPSDVDLLRIISCVSPRRLSTSRRWFHTRAVIRARSAGNVRPSGAIFNLRRGTGRRYVDFGCSHVTRDVLRPRKPRSFSQCARRPVSSSAVGGRVGPIKTALLSSFGSLYQLRRDKLSHFHHVLFIYRQLIALLGPKVE